MKPFTIIQGSARSRTTPRVVRRDEFSEDTWSMLDLMRSIVDDIAEGVRQVPAQHVEAYLERAYLHYTKPIQGDSLDVRRFRRTTGVFLRNEVNALLQSQGSRR
jgi:hypothetical protein